MPSPARVAVPFGRGDVRGLRGWWGGCENTGQRAMNNMIPDTLQLYAGREGNGCVEAS